MSTAILLAVPGALALSLLTGVSGQISLGNAAFMGIGGTTAGLLGGQEHWPFLLVLVAAAVLSGLVGVIVGIPSLRVRGLYLIIATLALQFVIQYAIQKIQTSTKAGVSGFLLPTATVGGWKAVSPKTWYFVLLGFAVVVTMIHINLVRSRIGRAWAVIRERDIAAEIIGIPVARYKISAFVVSSVIIGIQGALAGYYLGLVTYDMFTLSVAISYVAMIIIGGLGSHRGAIYGAAFVTALPYLLPHLVADLPGGVAHRLSGSIFNVQTFLYGLLVVLFLLFEPKGIARFGTASSVLRTVAVLEGAARGGRAMTSLEDDITVRRSEQPAVLRVEQLEVVYNHVQLAVQGLSIQVGTDEIVAVLGTNGAGKTTTLRAISGFLPGDNAEITDGRIVLDGDDVTGRPPHNLARRGLVLVPERDKVFATLTVQENLAVVAVVDAIQRQRPLCTRSRSCSLYCSNAVQLAGYLSGGEPRCSRSPRRCCSSRRCFVDELSFGLAPKVVETLMHTLVEVHRTQGTAVLLVEQNALAALRIADYAYVLENGRVVFDGTPERVHEHDDIREFYLGGTEGFTDLKQYKRKRRWWG